jgi:transposase
MRYQKSRKRPVNLKSLPKAKREQLRRLAFEAYRQKRSAYSVAKELELNESCVGAWFRIFAKRGEYGVAEKKRGPSVSPHATLTLRQRAVLAKAITGSTPDQLMFNFALWSSRAVVAFVRKRFHKDMGRRAARRCLQRLGFTYQCPIRRAREQCPARVAQWLEVEYPRIKAEAHGNKAKIMWGDEATIQVGGLRPRGFAVRGKPPVLKTTGNRSVRCNMISAVGNGGDLVFMTFSDSMNVAKFKKFVVQLIKEIGRPVTLIVDNLKVHHAKIMKDWLDAKKKECGFALEYLTSYSPELNPDEYLNRDVKASLSEQTLPKNTDAVRAAVRKHLKRRKKDVNSVKKLFEKKEVRYAAADTQ